VVNLCTFPAHLRFLYFHGQRHAWLASNRKMFTQKRAGSVLILFLSPFLFFTPEVHLMEMERIWSSRVIFEEDWKRFMTKTIIEWNNLILWVRCRVWLWLQFLSPTWRTFSVDRGACTERGLSFHPRRRPLQRSQWHVVNAASNDLPLLISQYRKYSYRPAPGASESDKTRLTACRGSE